MTKEVIKPFVVGIAGGSGSGKTYLLHSLLKHFTDDEICLLSQDHYYRPKSEQFVDENGEINFDLPAGIDDAKLLEDLSELLSGRAIEKIEYVFNNPSAQQSILTFCPKPIIVVEGLFIYHFKNLSQHFDYRIYIEADNEIKLARRLHRDQIERGYSKETILYQWNNHVLPSYEHYLKPYISTANKVIVNNHKIDTEIEEVAEMLRQRL